MDEQCPKTVLNERFRLLILIAKRGLAGLFRLKRYLCLMINHIEELPLFDLGNTFGTLRCICPKAEAALERSLDRHGQISSLVCIPTASGPEVIDGFKRLRACRRLTWPTVSVAFLNPPQEGPLLARIVGKIGMICLNRLTRSITALEEAMIIESLHREEGLLPADIAALTERDPIWVRRWFDRIGRMHDDVRRHVMSGSIGLGIARKLAKLPWNTQDLCLRKILKLQTRTRDVENIVRHLLANPDLNPTAIVEIVSAAPACDVPMPAASRREWFRRLAKYNRLQDLILAGAVEGTLPESSRDEWLLRDAIQAGKDLLLRLNCLLSDDFDDVEVMSWHSR